MSILPILNGVVLNKAFTLLELVIVIVATSILSVFFIPQFYNNSLLDATMQVVRHIKHTQHLALNDARYMHTDKLWYKSMWRISFRSKNCYVVSSNTDYDKNYDRLESAHDPIDRLLLYSNVECEEEQTDTKWMFLESYYSIDMITFSKACGSNRFIAFDHQGRPHKSLKNSHDLLKNKCIITIYQKENKAEITIRPETGYTTYKLID